MTQSLPKPYTPQSVSGVDLAFPVNVARLMPRREDIPEEFRAFPLANKWGELFSDMFYSGVKGLELKPKPGVDRGAAFAHVLAIMRSWEPKHEDKAAACAFLLSEWFEDAKWERCERVPK